MSDLQPLWSGIVIISILLALSISGGLIFAVLIPSQKNKISYIFVVFCLALWCWSLSALVYYVPALRFGLSGQGILHLYATFYSFVAVSFLIFVRLFTHTFEKSKAVVGFLTVGYLFAFLMIWSGQIFNNVSEDGLQYDPSPVGLVLLVVLLVYLVATLWMTVNRSDGGISWLRGPLILLIVGYASVAIKGFGFLSLDIVLVTAAAVWIGRAVLDEQLLSPVEQLNHDLRLANRDLTRAVNQLSDQKEHMEKLNNELRAANQHRTEFLANMSHELRTPLNSILGYSQLLQDGIYGELSPRQLDRLERIHRNGQHLSTLINAILDLNKIESGKLRLDVTHFDLADVIGLVVADFEPICIEKNLKFEQRISDGLPTYFGDPQRIRQILSNLMDNAVKFTSQGFVRLSVELIAVVRGHCETFPMPTSGWLRDGDWILIRVQDSGVGIAFEDQSRIFERFSQVDSSRTREYEGIGLGLAISRRLVEMHDGIIWVKSEPGQGSTFFVALPVNFVLPVEKDKLEPGHPQVANAVSDE